MPFFGASRVQWLALRVLPHNQSLSWCSISNHTQHIPTLSIEHWKQSLHNIRMFYKCIRKKLANKSKVKEPNLLCWLEALHSLDQVSKVKIPKWLWCMMLLHKLTLKIFFLDYHNIFGISWTMASWSNKLRFLENFQENPHFNLILLCFYIK